MVQLAPIYELIENIAMQQKLVLYWGCFHCLVKVKKELPRNGGPSVAIRVGRQTTLMTVLVVGTPRCKKHSLEGGVSCL